MPVVPGLTITVPASQPYYRITSASFLTRQVSHHKKVVNGEGALRSLHGARYNYPGAQTVYLAEDLLTCLSEKMYYFHKELLTSLDTNHITGIFPPFEQRFVLWEITFQTAIPSVLNLTTANASACSVYPSLMLNPSQDYEHLKSRRAAIQSGGYSGLRAPSSRIRGLGNMVVLFTDQSRNIQSITPYDVFFRLITSGVPHAPFINHATEVLDFEAGEVRIVSRSGAPPVPISSYQTWQRVEFNH